MVLTEPDAGSDVGAGRTKAVQQPDGTWHIEGVKRFITSAEHDLSDNIVHLVLARPEGAGPGTKGLSLFVVPKFHFDLETGELGERNGVYVTNVEHKMGLKVSTTCELTFGEVDGPGRRLAARRRARRHRADVQDHRVRPDDGRHQGDRHPVDRLPQRARLRQEAGAGRRPDADDRQGRAAGHHHPPPRRPPLADAAEGLRRGPARAGALHRHATRTRSPGRAARRAGDERDRARRAGQRPAAADRQGLRLGARPASCSAPSALQTFGGSGFLQDYPIEQYVRDAKIDTLYEGTTAIQGMDFFFRKIVRDKGQALTTSPTEIQEFAKGDAGNGQLDERARAARQGARGRAGHRRHDGRRAEPATRPRTATRNIYKVGQNTTRLLLASGDLVVGWLLLRQAEVALQPLAGRGRRRRTRRSTRARSPRPGSSPAQVLPRLAAERAIAEATDNALMDLDEASFDTQPLTGYVPCRCERCRDSHLHHGNACKGKTSSTPDTPTERRRADTPMPNSVEDGRAPSRVRAGAP